MALFQPSNITPSDLSGAGTIDATEDMAVTWQVNGTGNTPMTAYKIDIMRNDTGSTMLYTTGQITLSDPFYGADRLGNPVYFTATIAKEALSSVGIVNEVNNGYKLLITQWWSAADSVVQTSASAFIARSRPTISIINFTEEINTISYTFQGLYTQAQGDPIEWARWQISTGNGGDVLMDTGRVYNMGRMEASYDGFISGNNYSVRLSGQTINGVGFDTDWQVFTAQYAQTTFDGVATACANCDTDAVQVNFPSPLYTMGRGGGDWRIDNIGAQYNLVLPTASDSATWDSGDETALNLSTPFSLAWKGFITDLSSAVNVFSVLTGGGMLQLMADSAQISATVADTELFAVPRTLETTDEIVVGLQPASWFMKITSSGGTETEYSGTLNPWQSEINAITLYGPQTCEYVWVVKGNFTAEQMAETALNTPLYDSTTQFLASFESGLSAGAIRTAEPVQQILVYRQTAGKSTIQKCATLRIGATALRDYGAVNNQVYTYYLYGVTENGTSTTVIASNPVSMNDWNYTVLECEADANGDYHVQNEFRFALDVTSGTESNNNKPTMQANFTPYPLRQPTTQSYRSSTLTAYAARAKNGEYVDSMTKIAQLRALSTSPATKFLKTRKGEILMIETGEPISMSVIDKYMQQPVRVGLPWVEVGSTDGINVIATTDDAYWTLSE